jgi:hypothetical protein
MFRRDCCADVLSGVVTKQAVGYGAFAHMTESAQRLKHQLARPPVVHKEHGRRGRGRHEKTDPLAADEHAAAHLMHSVLNTDTICVVHRDFRARTGERLRFRVIQMGVLCERGCADGDRLGDVDQRIVNDENTGGAQE